MPKKPRTGSYRWSKVSSNHFYIVWRKWKHSRLMEWSGVRFLRLNEEMSLLYLCDNGGYHQWFRIKWLGDVAVLLTRCPGIDWMLLLDLAGRLDLKRTLGQAALLAHWCYGIPLAEPLQSLIGYGNKTAALARGALRAIVTNEREYNYPPFFDRWRREWYLGNLRTRFPYRRPAPRWQPNLIPISDRVPQRKSPTVDDRN